MVVWSMYCGLPNHLKEHGPTERDCWMGVRRSTGVEIPLLRSFLSDEADFIFCFIVYTVRLHANAVVLLYSLGGICPHFRGYFEPG